MTPREAGFARGVHDARAAWCGTTWKRINLDLPVNHLDRQDWLEGYAAGFAAFNRTIEVAA